MAALLNFSQFQCLSSSDLPGFFLVPNGMIMPMNFDLLLMFRSTAHGLHAIRWCTGRLRPDETQISRLFLHSGFSSSRDGRSAGEVSINRRRLH